MGVAMSVGVTECGWCVAVGVGVTVSVGGV